MHSASVDTLRKRRFQVRAEAALSSRKRYGRRATTMTGQILPGEEKQLPNV